jgi:hypothetical protein
VWSIAFFFKKEMNMETRVAVMGIIVEDTNAVNILLEEWEYLTNKNI